MTCISLTYLTPKGNQTDKINRVHNLWHDAKSNKSNQEKINAWRLNVVSQRIYNHNSVWLEKGSSYQKQMPRMYDNTT